MNILALVDSPDHVCYRYRLHAYRHAFEAQGWSLKCVALGDGDSWPAQNVLRHADCVVVQRRLLPLWKQLRLRWGSASLIYDFDDAVFLRDSYSRRSQQSRRRLWRFRTFASRCDRVIAGNRFLAVHAARFCPSSRVLVVPTCVDPSRYRPAAHYRRGRGVELVWIGSRSTVQSFEVARSMFERLGRAVPGLRLRVICDHFPQLDHIEVIRRAWSASTEAGELAQADIGISWLPDDLWSRGKCGLKVIQYMAAGLPVVANPVGVQAEMVLPGRTGYLAATAQQWIDAVAELAENPELRSCMGHHGRRRVEERYSVQRWAPRLVELLRQAVAETAAAPLRARSARRSSHDQAPPIACPRRAEKRRRVSLSGRKP